MALVNPISRSFRLIRLGPHIGCCRESPAPPHHFCSLPLLLRCDQPCKLASHHAVSFHFNTTLSSPISSSIASSLLNNEAGPGPTNQSTDSTPSLRRPRDVVECVSILLVLPPLYGDCSFVSISYRLFLHAGIEVCDLLVYLWLMPHRTLTPSPPLWLHCNYSNV